MASKNNLETPWTNAICKVARDRGVLVYNLKAGPDVPAGWPDRMFVAFSGVYFVEFKGPETVVTDQQKEVLRNLKARHKRTFICRKVKDSSGGVILCPVTNSVLARFTGAKEFMYALKEASNA